MTSLLLVCCLGAHAQTELAVEPANPWSVGVHVASYHTKPAASGKPWRELHVPSLWLRYAPEPTLSGQVGFYPDSSDRKTLYALADLTPLVLTSDVRAGAFWGGRLYRTNGAIPVTHCEFIGGLVGRWQPGAWSVATRFSLSQKADGYVFTLEAGRSF